MALIATPRYVAEYDTVHRALPLLTTAGCTYVLLAVAAPVTVKTWAFYSTALACNDVPVQSTVPVVTVKVMATVSVLAVYVAGNVGYITSVAVRAIA